MPSFHYLGKDLRKHKAGGGGGWGDKMLVPSIFFFSHNIFYPFYPLPDHKILDWSKLKQIADDILTQFTTQYHILTH